MQELDDVGVIETLMYLDLTHKLHRGVVYFEFRPLLDKGRLLNNFDSKDILAILCNEFVTSGESSLAKEVTLDVFGDGVGFEAVILNDVQILVSCVIGEVRSG